jgi:hypothetical protein
MVYLLINLLHFYHNATSFKCRARKSLVSSTNRSDLARGTQVLIAKDPLLANQKPFFIISVQIRDTFDLRRTISRKVTANERPTICKAQLSAFGDRLQLLQKRLTTIV